jgi:hypothetical protein
MEDELRSAQFNDLRSEFLHHEAKLRDEYLGRVAAQGRKFSHEDHDNRRRGDARKPGTGVG